MKKLLLNIWADKSKLDHRLRWAVRILLFVGVAYLVFFKQESTKTVFVEPSERYARIIVLEHIINEGLKKDSIIQIKYHEIPDYSGATADSLERLISKHIEPR